MLGQWGKTWPVIRTGVAVLALVLLPGLAQLFCLPLPAQGSLILPLSQIDSQGPMEAQLLRERPLRSPGAGFFTGSSDREGETSVKLPGNLELRISFLYDGQRAKVQPERPVHSHLLFTYSMDYRLRPNLQVGLTGFLYQPPTDLQLFQRRYSSVVMGWGPGLKYDLGRWSFTVRSQMESGSRESGQNLQNWFRVWYAF
jgi:hypothetical protein